MKILIISSLYHPTPPSGYGGTERFVYHFSKSLISMGNEIRVLVSDKSESDISSFYIKTSESKLLSDFKETLSTFKPDITVINGKYTEIIDLLSKHNARACVILHNNIRSESSWLDIINKFSHNIHFSFISESHKNKTVLYLRKKYPLFKNDSNLHNFGFGMSVIEYKKYYKNIPKEYSLYIGTIGRYKGVLDIVKEFSSNQRPLLVVGPCTSDYEQDYYKEVLDTIKNSPNIKYISETKNEVEKINLILKADALIIATGYDPKEKDCDEAFGLVMLEANSLGVPVIGFSKGNINDYVRNGVNGYKFSNITEISSLLKKVDSKSLSLNCLNVSEEYDINTVTGRYFNFFQTI